MNKYGPWRGPLEAAKLTKDVLKPFSGFATATFHPPRQSRSDPTPQRYDLTHSKTSSILPPSWTSPMRFAATQDGDLEYELSLQFYVNDELTPIEDGPSDGRPTQTRSSRWHA